MIASGGVGNLEHLVAGVVQGHADAVLAASIFHYGEFYRQTGQGLMVERNRSAGLSFKRNRQGKIRSMHRRLRTAQQADDVGKLA